MGGKGKKGRGDSRARGDSKGKGKKGRGDSRARGRTPPRQQRRDYSPPPYQGGDRRGGGYKGGRDDSRDRRGGGYKGGGKGRSPPRRRTPPRGRSRDGYKGGGRGRSRTPYRRSPSPYKGGGKGKGKEGQHKISIENLPDDMSWTELKELAAERGNSVTFARTFEYRGAHCGMVEFASRRDADNVVRDLDDRRIEGARDRLRVSHGDLSLNRDAQKYGGRFEDKGHSKGKGDKGYDRNAGDDDPLMTLFIGDLPHDANQDEILRDLEPDGAARAVMMNRQGETNAFIRFKTVEEAEASIDAINDGKVRVCGQVVRAEMARRNTQL